MVHGLETLKRLNDERIERESNIALFNSITVVERGQHARLLWEESTGRVIVFSSYGDWSYCWNHRGNQSVRAFLLKLDSDYMAGKFLGVNSHVFSTDRTANSIREHILRSRRAGEITSMAARDEMDHVKQLANGSLDYREWLDGTNLDDAYELRSQELNPCWVNFWNRLWVPGVLPALEAYAVQGSVSHHLIRKPL